MPKIKWESSRAAVDKAAGTVADKEVRSVIQQ